MIPIIAIPICCRLKTKYELRMDVLVADIAHKPALALVVAADKRIDSLKRYVVELSQIDRPRSRQESSIDFTISIFFGRDKIIDDFVWNGHACVK